MIKNEKYWNTFCKPPGWALKTIQAGRLKDKTDINPQWRYQAMTEAFGFCGVGWYYEIVNLWIEDGANDERMAFCKINLFVKIDGEWSQPIPGIGGSMLVASEKNGMHNSDEAYKMATTDALSVAMKMLGVGADIYSGDRYDSKYGNDTSVPPVKKSKDFITAVEEILPDVPLFDFESLIKNYGVSDYHKITDRETQKTFFVELKKLVNVNGLPFGKPE